MSDMHLAWGLSSLCLNAPDLSLAQIAASAYERVCRTDFDAPGCCVINLGKQINSQGCRQFMAELTNLLGNIHRAGTDCSLSVLSAARFDQQISTKPHLDGGPEECLLMLGYEPTEVNAELEIFDYARCAFDMGLTPADFLEHHNPMFQSGYEMLRPYRVRIPCFSSNDFQIVCINNSHAAFDLHRPRWQGVLHSAKILSPDAAERRVVNSMMLAPQRHVPESDTMGANELREFVRTSHVKRRGYDKPDLQE